MKRMQAYKFKLKTKSKQARKLRCFAGACRYIYNESLSLQKSRYEEGLKKLSYADLCKFLTGLKADPKTAWLNHSPSQTLQQSLKDLERAYQNFFAQRANFTQFKKRGIKKDAFRYPQGFKLDQKNSRIYLPKIGWLKYFNSQNVFGEIKNITVSCKAGNWFIAIQTEREVSISAHAKNDMIGIDVGVAKFAMLSTRQSYKSIHALKSKYQQLKFRQKRLSRKIKFSRNWIKCKNKLSRFHHHIANVRLDYLHRTSHDISKNHAMIVLEDLQIKNMSKSASGTMVNPGVNEAKSGLNRAILDQGWGELVDSSLIKHDGKVVMFSS